MKLTLWKHVADLIQIADPGSLLSNDRNEKKQRAFVFLFLVLVGNSLFLWFNAFRCFSHYDMSSWLDASWRVYRGQKPYIDFWCWVGPIQIYFVALFFHVFGFGKLAIWAHLVFVHSIVIVSLFMMIKKIGSFAIVIAIVLLGMTCFYWNVAFPFHYHTAHFLAILGITSLALKIPFSSKQVAFAVGTWCGIMAALSFMTKANIGLVYGFVFCITFLVSGKVFWSAFGFGLGFLIASAATWHFLGLNELFLDQTLKTYVSGTHRRLLNLLGIQIWFKNFYWIPFTLVMASVLVHKDNLRKALPQFILFLGCIFIGIYVIATDSMIPTVNYLAWGVCMALAFQVTGTLQVGFYDEKFKVFDALVRAFLLLTVAGMILIGVIKGMRLTFWRQIGMSPIGDYKLQSEPLKGWRSDRQMGVAIDDLAQFIKKEIPKEDSLLIMTALQILYALTDRDSFKGVPFGFNPMYDLGERRMYAQVNKVVTNHPPDWIIYHPELLPATTMVSFSNNAMKFSGLEEFVKNEYREVYESEPFKVLKLKRKGRKK